MMRFRLVAGLVAIALCSRDLRAQRGADGFSDLRIDGNGIDALSTTVGSGFEGQTTAYALTWIARLARLNLTFDPQLAAMSTRLSIPPHDRSAAAALLEVARESRISVRVSASGQIIVAPLPAPPVVQVRLDTVRRSVELPAVKTEAPRVERREFDASARIGGVAITSAEVRSTPSFVEPDVLRAVQQLPGVEARSDWSAGFNVRGGEADQNLVLLDGYPIFDPFHLGGLFSTFIPSSVGRVDLRTGGMPVQYDGRLSGSLDVRSLEPTSSDAHGSAEISLLSSSASVGKAIADGAGSWIIAGRRTYADYMADLYKPGAFPYHFQDIQGHLTHTLGSQARISLTAYDGLDVGADRNASSPMSGSWGNSVIGATIAKTIDDRPVFLGVVTDSITLEQRASVTRYGGHVDFPSELLHVSNGMTDARLSGSATLHSARLTQSFGYELSRQTASFHSTSGLVQDLGDLIPFDSIDAKSTAASAYVDELWRPRSNLFVEAGLRFDDVQPASWAKLLPRGSVKYLITPSTAITAAAGTYAQWVHSLGREEEPIRPFQFWVTSSSTAPVSRATDVTLGVEHWLSPSQLVHVEGFTKRYVDLLTPSPTSDPRVSGDEFLPVTGTSYGVDLLVRQFETRASPFSGWLSYSYGFNTRVRPDGTRYYPIQDRRHDLNLVGSWHVAEYLWGARINLGSGIPSTPVLGQYVRYAFDPATGRWVSPNQGSYEQNIPAALNSERVPYYLRADVSVKRTGRLFGLEMSPYVSVVNVLNFHNPAAYLYTFDSYRGNRATFPNLPFVPTFGVSIVF